MLTRAIGAAEGLFMQQACETVAFGHLFHDLHGQLVVVGGQVRILEDGGQLMLGRRYFVVLGFRVNPQLPQLLVQILHEGGDTGLNGAEVMVLQLLALRRLGAKKGATGIHQVLAFFKECLVDEEVFLLGTYGGDDSFGVLVAEETQNPQRLGVHYFHGAKKRGLFVQRLAAVGAKRGGDAEGAVLDKGVRGGVPGGVAAGLKGGPQAAGGEAGGIRLALDEFLAGELHDDVAVSGGGDETIVLLGGDSGHRLKPVGKVGGSFFDGPVLHGVGHHVCHAQIQGRSLLNGCFERLVGVFRKPFLHNGVVKHETAEQFWNLAHTVFLQSQFWQ